MPNRISVVQPSSPAIGGWTYEPWRKNFYPEGLAQARELEYASRQLTAIEINGTFYRLQKPEYLAKWRDQTPDGFVFTVKAPRYATIRKVLGEAGESIERFVASGPGELGEKLGPILWQFHPTKRFDRADFEAFLKLLPAKIGGAPAELRSTLRLLRCGHGSSIAATPIGINPKGFGFAARGECVLVRSRQSIGGGGC